MHFHLPGFLWPPATCAPPRPCPPPGPLARTGPRFLATLLRHTCWMHGCPRRPTSRALVSRTS
eukprot:5114045-Heterocapsa_arctica.AAC.1